MTLGHISKQWTNEQAASQAQVTYEKYKKIKSFQDVGYLLSYYVVSGGEVTANIKRNDIIDVADIVASLDDNILSRDGMSFEVKIPNTIYYLDFDKSGDWHWGTAHVQGTAGVDYLAIAEVTTNALGLVNLMLDKRGHVGGMRLKDNYGLEGYATSEQMADIAINISQFPRNEGEVDDTDRFNRAISYLSGLGGGELRLGLETYELNSFNVPDKITIRGRTNDNPWATNKVTILKFIGLTGTFITIESYYDKRSTIANLNIINEVPSREKGSTAIRIKRTTNNWGASATIDKVNIIGFGVGIQHHMTYQSLVVGCSVWQCGIGISYNAKIEGSSQDPSSSFGNVNLVEKTTINECTIGVELASDTLNTFKYTDIEKCYIGVHVYQLSGGFFKPQQHKFKECWFEANGWANPEDKVTNTNPRYLICNSEIDSSLVATGANSADMPTIEGCRNDGNVSPEIPSFNTNYQVFTINHPPINRRYSTDESMQSLYSKPKYTMQSVSAGKSSTFRDIFTVSNQGIKVNLGFNNYEKKGDYSTGGTSTQTLNINYSSVVNPDTSGANQFSTLALMNVITVHNDGARCSAVFLIADFALNVKLTVSQLGETFQQYPILSGNGIEVTDIQGTGSTNKTFNVKVTGNIIKNIIVKINHFPNGLLNV